MKFNTEIQNEVKELIERAKVADKENDGTLVNGLKALYRDLTDGGESTYNYFWELLFGLKQLAEKIDYSITADLVDIGDQLEEIFEV